MSIIHNKSKLVVIGLSTIMLIGTVGAGVLTAKLNALEIQNSNLKSIEAGTVLGGDILPRLVIKLNSKLQPQSVFYLTLKNAQWLTKPPTVSIKSGNQMVSNLFEVQRQSDKLLKITYKGTSPLDIDDEIIVNLSSKLLGGAASVSISSDTEAITNSEEVFTTAYESDVQIRVSSSDSEFTIGEQNLVNLEVRAKDNSKFFEKGDIITIKINNGYIPIMSNNNYIEDFTKKINISTWVKTESIGGYIGDGVSTITVSPYQNNKSLKMSLPIVPILPPTEASSSIDTTISITNETKGETYTEKIGTFINPLSFDLMPTDIKYIEKGTILSPSFSLTEREVSIFNKGVVILNFIDENNKQVELKQMPNITAKGDIELGNTKAIYKDSKIVGVEVDIDKPSVEELSTIFVSDIKLDQKSAKENPIVLNVINKTSDKDILLLTRPYVNLNKDLPKPETIKSKVHQLSDKVMVEDNRIMLTLDEVSKILDLSINNISYDKGIIRLTEGSQTVYLKEDTNIMIVNGIKIGMDTKVITKDDKCMVPVSYIANALGYELMYDKVNNLLEVSKSENAQNCQYRQV